VQGKADARSPMGNALKEYGPSMQPENNLNP
jgi:hypothetical protein